MLPRMLPQGAGPAGFGNAPPRYFIRQIKPALVAEFLARAPGLDFHARSEELGEFVRVLREIETAAHRRLEIAQPHLGDALLAFAQFAHGGKLQLEDSAEEALDQALQQLTAEVRRLSAQSSTADWVI